MLFLKTLVPLPSKAYFNPYTAKYDYKRFQLPKRWINL